MDEPHAPSVAAGPDGVATPAGDGAPSPVLEALARLLAVASVYPPTHPRIAEIVDPVLNAVRSGSADGSGLRLVVAEHAESEHATAGAERLVRDLDGLGVARIEIDGGVAVADLFAFAKFLRQHAGDAGDQGFRHVDFSKLPPTIRVQERSFGIPTFGGEEPAVPADAPGGREGDADAAVAAAEPAASEDDAADEDDESQEPMDPELVDLVWRGVRQALAEHEAARPTPAIAGGPMDEHEAASAISKALGGWIDRQHARARERGRASPEKILANAERELPTILPGVSWSPVIAVLRRTIRTHMREGFREESRAEFGSGTAVPFEPAAAAGSDAELVRAIRAYTEGAAPFDLDAEGDRAEHLSILLHVLDAAPSSAPSRHVLERLGRALADEPFARERDVLVGWLRGLASRDESGETDARLLPVTAILRRASPAFAPAILLDACRKPHQALAGPLWPHLAYEAFTDPGGDRRPGEHEQIVQLVTSVPQARLRSESARFTAIVAENGGAVARSMIEPPRRELHPLYAALLDAPRETGFPAVVTAAFAAHPPDHPAGGALLVLDPSEDVTHRLVARILREGDAATAASRALAVEILVGALRALPVRRRDEEWVPAALIALGRLPCLASAAMLHEVCSSRRFVLLAAWPDSARDAAADAVSALAAAAPEVAA